MSGCATGLAKGSSMAAGVMDVHMLSLFSLIPRRKVRAARLLASSFTDTTFLRPMVLDLRIFLQTQRWISESFAVDGAFGRPYKQCNDILALHLPVQYMTS